MAREKSYPEDVLIEKVQNGEFGWLDYVNHFSKEWKDEYEHYCRIRDITISDESAEQFIEWKQNRLEEALLDGEA